MGLVKGQAKTWACKGRRNLRFWDLGLRFRDRIRIRAEGFGFEVRELCQAPRTQIMGF